MYYTTYTSRENFWGKPVSSTEYTVHEDYTGEVYEMLLEMIENAEIDSLPETLEITACSGHDWCDDDIEFDINVSDYLTKEQIKELEKMLEENYEIKDEENENHSKDA